MFCILLTIFYVHIITTFIQIYETNKTHGFKTYQQITWLTINCKVHWTTELLINYNSMRKNEGIDSCINIQIKTYELDFCFWQ